MSGDLFKNIDWFPAIFFFLTKWQTSQTFSILNTCNLFGVISYMSEETLTKKKTRFCSKIGLTLSSSHTFCTYFCCYSYGSNLNLYFSFVDSVGSAFSTLIDLTLYVKFMTNTFSSNTALPLVIVLLIRIYFFKDCLIIKGT